MGLLDIFQPTNQWAASAPGGWGAQPSPFSQWVNANPYGLNAIGQSVSALGRGMVGHGSDMGGLVSGINDAVTAAGGPIAENMALQRQQQQQAKQVKAAQDAQNRTVQWLQQKGQADLAAAVQNGMISGGDAFKLAMGQQGGDKAAFSLTPVWGVDANGNPVLGQLSNQGGVQLAPMPDGVKFGKDPIKMDAGDRIILLDPVTRQPIGQIPKNGNVPEGYQQANGIGGGLSPMPNSPQDMQRRGQIAQAGSAMTTLEAKNKIVVDKIDQAMKQANWWTTGTVGGLTSGVGGTPAFDLAETLKTIKANIGFDELQKMRDASPTGGALGAISDREIAFLQSTITSIEQAQSEGQLKANLKLLRDYLVMSQDQRRKAFADTFGNGTAQPTQLPPSAGDATGVPQGIDPQTWQYMTPEERALWQN